MRSLTVYTLAPDAQPTDFIVYRRGYSLAFQPQTQRAADWWFDNVSNGPLIGGSYEVGLYDAEGILRAAQQAGLTL
jgi:hypothetical protein